MMRLYCDTFIAFIISSWSLVESRGANMPQQKDIVKIAIQMPGAYPQLIQLDQVMHTHNFKYTLF